MVVRKRLRNCQKSEPRTKENKKNVATGDVFYHFSQHAGWMTLCKYLLDDTLLDKDLLEDLHTALDLLFTVSSHQCEADQSILWSACGRNDRVDEYATVESQLSDKERLVAVTHIQRNDRTLSLTNLEATSRKRFSA